MRVKKRVTIVCLLWVMVLALAGCGTKKEDKPDPKELIGRMVEAAEGAVVTRSDCQAELYFLFSDGVSESEYTCVFNSHNEYDKESCRSGSDIKWSDNSDSAVNIKFNLVEEKGELYHYVYQDNQNWIKYEACFDKEGISRNFVSSMNLENAEILGFETQDILVDGKEAYKLTLTLKDAAIRELFFESGMKCLIMGKEYGSVNLDDVAVTMEYYVEPETAKVLKVEAKLEGMQNFIRHYYEYTLGELAEETMRTVKSTVCTLVYDNISYDDLELPMMNFEDKKNSTWIPQKDSVYTLKILDDQVDITWPKGWCATTQDKHMLTLRNNTFNGVILRTYSLDFDADEETIRAGYIDTTIEAFKEADLYVSEQEGPDIGAFKTYEVILQNGVISIAYTKIGKSWLSIVVVDYTSSRLDKSLPEVLDGVTWE